MPRLSGPAQHSNGGTALVRRPGPRLADGLVTHIERTAVDPDRAREQHAAYRAALVDAGWHVHDVEPADDLPDAAFVEDAAVFLGDRAVLTRPGDPSRRGEVASVAAALDRLGIAPGELAEGTLDGGDVLQAGGRLFVGRSTRTDDAGIRALSEAAGREAIAVPVSGCLHLKTAATALPDGTIVANLDCVDAAAFGPLPVVGTPEPLGANVLAVSAECVVVPASAPRTAQLVRERGFDVVALDISEFEAVEAGLTCLSVLLPERRA